MLNPKGKYKTTAYMQSFEPVEITCQYHCWNGWDADGMRNRVDKVSWTRTFIANNWEYVIQVPSSID